MTFIAMRADGAEWQFVEGHRYPDEAFLRDQLFEEPRLIPATELGLDPKAAIVGVREMSLPGSGSSDIVLVESNGAVTIVECKLATNPERKRAVIGQVLDYASSLSGMSYDDFDSRVRTVRQRPLHELMAEQVEDEQWDEQQFVDDTAATLASGSFTLVIAIDQMDPDLERILRYVSSRSRGALSIFGLEMRYHRHEDVEVIIPHIANPIDRTEVENRREHHDWNPKRFRDVVNKLEDDAMREALTDILDFALSSSDVMFWGRAKDYGSFGYGLRMDDGRSMSLFTYYTSGTFSLNLATLNIKAPSSVFETFVGRIAGLQGFDRVGASLTGWPQFQTRQTLSDESVRAEFKEAVIELRASWSGQSVTT